MDQSEARRSLLWLLAGFAAVGAAILALWASHAPDKPPLLRSALFGAGLATLLVAARAALSALRHRLEGDARFSLPEPRLFLVAEWATVFVAMAAMLHLMETWRWWGIPLGILAASVLPSFDFLVRPMLLLLHGRLGAAPDDLASWLEEVAGGARGRAFVHVRVYDGPLRNAFATGVLPFSRLIILGRPLLQHMSAEHLRAVAAHELGHLRLGHPRWSFLVALAGTAMFALWLHWVFRSGLLDAGPVSLGMLLAMSGSALSGAIFMGLLPGLIAQRLELAADRFAARVVGAEPVAAALRELDRLTDGRVGSGGLTHPPLMKRLKNLERNPT